MNDTQFGLQPRMASRDFAQAGLGVHSPLTAWRPLEVLYRVGDVDLLARNAHFPHHAVEQLAGGANEWAAADVFRIAWLLADEHGRRPRGTFAKHCLRGVLKQRATFAFGRGLAQSSETQAARQ